MVKRKRSRLPGRELYEWVQALVCSVLAVVVLFTFAVRATGVSGSSMRETLRQSFLNHMTQVIFYLQDLTVVEGPEDRPLTLILATEPFMWMAWSWRSPTSGSPLLRTRGRSFP